MDNKDLTNHQENIFRFKKYIFNKNYDNFNSH